MPNLLGVRLMLKGGTEHAAKIRRMSGGSMLNKQTAQSRRNRKRLADKRVRQIEKKVVAADLD